VTLGYVYILLSLTSFGLIGIFAKFADMKQCRPSAVYAAAYGWALAFSALFIVAARSADFHAPPAVYIIALPFGLLSAVGGIVFMAGIRYGKISTSWLIINLSAAIPALGSLIFYHEPVSPRKVAVLLLAALSVFLLWKDKQAEEAKLELARQSSDQGVAR
jgi:drug/metabolite transporter (DMT)-like permease